MRIAIARLRSQVRYDRPLQHIMDSFFHVLRCYVERHPEHEWLYYGFAWGDGRPRYDVLSIAAAEVVIVPTEGEYIYHTPGFVNPLFGNKSHERTLGLMPHLQGKRVVLLRFDRRDDEDLFQRYTWPDCPIDYRTVDEVDFPLSINGLKARWLREARQTLPKQYDLVHYGTDKRKTVGGEPSGDSRHEHLRAVYKDPLLKALWIGKLPFKPCLKWMTLEQMLPHLAASRATLCFNWRDSRAVTARYFEAVGAGVVPLVHRDYGEGVLPIAGWQRFEEPGDVLRLLRDLRSKDRLPEVEKALWKVLPRTEVYEQEFDRQLTAALKG